MEIIIAGTNRQKEAIEGPSAAQAKRMAATRRDFLASEQAHLAAGRDDAAFNTGCAAFDIECDLVAYGFDITTGKRVKA